MVSQPHDDIPPSINVSLPPEAESIISALVREDKEGFSTWTTVIHDALWAFRASQMTASERLAEFRALIQEGIDSGDAVEVTPEFWENLMARAWERHERIKKAKTGNLLLPTELYEFIQEQVARGLFPTHEEVICAALQRLWEQQKS